MNAALDGGITIAIAESHNAQHEGRDCKEKSDDRKPAEDAQVIGNQSFRVLVRNDAPVASPSLGVLTGLVRGAVGASKGFA